MIVMLLLVLLLVVAAPVGAQENSLPGGAQKNSLPGGPQENSLPRDVPAASYRILSLGFFAKTSTLQNKLDEASSTGYRVVGGYERVLIMRKGPHDERYVYTAAGKGDVKPLERQMNAAALTGFRLVPEAVLSSHLFAVMEKRVGTTPRGADYRLLSFTTDYEIYGTAPRLAVSGGFETDVIDQRLAEMAVAGYRIVALVTRTLEERTIRKPVVGGLSGKVLGKRSLTVEIPTVRQELIVFFEKESDASVVTNVRDAARRYHAVMAGTEAELEAQLNRAAAAGYGLLTAAGNGFPETIAVVEKLAPDAARPAYRVLVPGTISRLQDELAHAAEGGWIPHTRGVIDPSGGRHDHVNEVLLVVERRQPVAPGHFLVLATARVSTLAKELTQATAAGFEVAVAGPGHGEWLLVLRGAFHRGEPLTSP